MGAGPLSNKTPGARRFNILVTPKEACELLGHLQGELFKEAEFFPVFGRVEDSRKLIGLLKDKDGVILDLEKMTRDIFSLCPRLKVISRFGEGCDAIDLKEAERFNVKVARTRGVASRAVAMHAVSLILALTHNITENDRNLKKGKWLRRPNMPERSITLGVMGFGMIGKQVADIASKIGFKILVYDIIKQKDRRYNFAGSVDEICELSDILTLHFPLTPKTVKIISGNTLKKLKNKFLVNTSRGGLVDEAALLKSLETNGIAGYAADVFSREPVADIAERLAAHPKVIASPHVAALDKDTAIEMTKRAAVNALSCLKNKHNEVISYV